YVGSDEGANDLVIMLADLHANPGVQRNLAKLIEFYATYFAIPECFVEGASGEGDLSTFEHLPDLVKARFADWMLERAYLVGAELFCLQCHTVKCDLYGVDPGALYHVHSAAAATTMKLGSELSRRSVTALARFMSVVDRAPADFAVTARLVEDLSGRVRDV